MGRNIRIVVGEGRTAQQGLLRFVLEGEGFDVVGEAGNAADLAIAIAEGQPDVVVLDDGIGVMAVSMVREVLRDTKIVLVWPSAVVPIGGDARVEPAKILNDLGPAVRHVAPVGVGAGLTETFERPEWIDKVRKDPAALRDKLGASGKEPTKRPSVTQLQRRGARLHPGRKTKPAKTAEQEPAAPVVPLPVAAAPADAPVGPTAEAGVAPAIEPADVEPEEERSEWNRRLGTLALSGAAAISALVLAVALGGGRVTPEILRGGGFVPPGTGFVSGATEAGPFIGGSLGGSGYSPIPTAPTTSEEGGAPQPTAPRPTGSQPGDESGSGGGDVSGPSGGDFQGPDTTGGGGGNGGNGGGGGNGGNGGGDGGGGGDVSRPERSTGNPFGGPPSQLGLTPAHGAGLGAMVNDAAKHGVRTSSAHAHKH